jgi:hypothetical protein
MSPRDMFLIFLMGEPIGCCKHGAPRDVSYISLKWWGLDFPSSSSSQAVSIKFLLFPSITHQNPFVLIKFSKNSHQIPLVPIKFPLFSSSSHCSHQVPIVLINFLLFPTQLHINPHKALNFVRDSDGRVLN